MLRELKREGVAFENRVVDERQDWLDEALQYGDSAPIMVRDGKATVGFRGEVG